MAPRKASQEDGHVVASAGGPAFEAPTSLHVAIVCTIDGPRFAAVAESEPQCLAQIAAYVKEQAAVQLWPPSAARIHELFDAGDVMGAITGYFHRSGERWEAEWLVTTCLRADPRSGVWSDTVPFPKALGWGLRREPPESTEDSGRSAR